MNIRDGICAYVGGGLGNQLFILAAAWNQARRLDVPLYLDTSFSSVSGTRPFELDTVSHPGILLGDESPWRSMRVSSLRVLPVPRLVPPVRRPIYRERDGARYDASIEKVTPGTTLFGYFQSAAYFPRVADSMRDMLLTADVTAAESEILERYAADPRITVHLRRGDYLDAPPEQQVLASSVYAERAHALLRRMGIDHPLRVFSDSPDLVRDELSKLDADIEVVDRPESLSPIATIRAMAAAPAIVIANSTFSWWAGWLLSQLRGEDAVVIAPRPWDPSGSAKADLIGRTWLTLDVR